jgi:hypothetical protein
MSTDPFTDARSSFTKLDDLIDRTVLVAPQEIQTLKSTLRGQEGKEYDAITADVIVLDGEPDDEIGIETVPTTIEGMRISGSVVVNQLRPKVKSHGLVLGRVSKQKAQTKGFNDAYVLDSKSIDKDDPVRKVARTEGQKYLDARETSPFSDLDT